MTHIQLMDETLANKIAAGEVIERPASVVKELVENAIDAGSTSIEVSLEEAGLQLVRVTDDGRGMDEEDAVLAFERHATSKVKNEFDLFRIRTLGFRGEALATIAAVSKVTLWTSDGRQTGTELEIEGGELLSKRPGALRKGTDIAVRQLFYNTPARLKHMKSLQTELGHTIDLINRLAFSYPRIRFHLMNDGKTIVQTMGRGDQLRNVASIYGVPVARKMIAFEGSNADYTISGWVSLPELTRASKKYMTLLVNHRWVKSYAIDDAILKGLHTFLPIGRYPIIILNVEADPQLTDVNVHPSKKHVRLGKEGELLTLIEQTVREAVQRHVTIPKAAPPQPKRSERSSEQVSLWESTTPYGERTKPSTFPEGRRTEPLPDWLPVEELPVVSFDEGEKEQFDGPMEPVAEEQFPQLEYVGQVHGTYIIAQNEDGFYMIDQHAAQERIKYEYFRDQIGEVNHEERQLLLVPLIFHYSKDEMARIEEHRAQLERVGIFLEPFGRASYTVKEYPSWFPKEEASELIESIIEQVMTKRSIDIAKLREETAIMMSCKRSIKANHYLRKEDAERLLHDLAEAEHPYTCPHGRPVLIHFSTREIERMFKRIM